MMICQLGRADNNVDVEIRNQTHPTSSPRFQSEKHTHTFKSITYVFRVQP